MFDYLGQRKKIMNQYEDLTNRLPKKYMNIHFKSINYKKGVNDIIFLPSEILEQNKNGNIISSLDPETKSFILNNKYRLKFYKYSSSFDKFNSNQKKFLKNKMFNKQTIILAKYNNNINNVIRNDKINGEIDKRKVINKKNKYIHINEDKYKYNNSFSGNNFKKSNDSKENKNHISQKQILKVNEGKNFSKSFYNEGNKYKKKKNFEIIINEINNNYQKNDCINNFIYKKKNNQKCQTSFTSINSPKENEHSKKNINNNLLSLKKKRRTTKFK